ncbi:MAG: inositol monophosphatase [Lachnospiraceae bacterium]|nr:inositol monophosphatase [Lachnospiraceae bacterium]
MTNQTIQDITEAVLDASSIMLEAEHITEATHSKSGHANFVTEYDTRVQKELFDRLGKILPEASFMGEEESSWSYSDKGYQFIIDPIDGTTNFIKKNHTSCISVGLLKDGEPLLGMVYNPYRDELFYAKKGEGAYLNQKPIRVSAEPLENSILIFGTSPYYENLWKPAFDTAWHYFQKTLDLRRSGSAAIDLCDIACGRAELFFELKLSPWDYAAGSLLVTEAGGHICGANLNAPQFARPQGIVAYGSGITKDDLTFFTTLNL